ncbi:MAG: hypothetical protein ACKPEA_02735, partial [Planctomycetota bacterium]
MPDAVEAISGIDAMRGVGQERAKGFWADVWQRVLRRGGARFGLAWISVVGFFAIFAPLLANSHPWMMERLGKDGSIESRSWPLLAYLSAPDWTLLVGAFVGVPWIILGSRRLSRGERIGVLVVSALEAGVVVALAPAIIAWCSEPARAEGLKAFARSVAGEWAIAGVIALGASMAAAWVPTVLGRGGRVALAVAVAALSGAIAVKEGGATLVNYERYLEQE